uniref:Rab/GTPase n=1 Tax=Ganoderma boninense TaxID=34458 RepID=A0A5K1K0A9_9APHY|nr:Putative Rab/GTPase [Ganoderma boninense]
MPLFASPPAPPPPLTHDEGFRKPMPIPDTPRAVSTPPQSRQLAEVVQTIPSPRASSSVTASSFPSKDRGLPSTLVRTATQTPRQCHPPRPRINQLKRKLDEVSYDHEEVVVIRKPIAALPRRAAPSLPPVQSHTSLPAPPIPYATRPTPPLAAPTPVSTAHGESQRADAVLERSDDASRVSPAPTPTRLTSATSTPTLAPTASPSSSKSRTSREDDLALVFAYLESLLRESVVSPRATNPSPPKSRAPYTPSSRRRSAVPDGKSKGVAQDVEVTVAHAPLAPNQAPRPLSFSFSSQNPLSIKVSVE